MSLAKARGIFGKPWVLQCTAGSLGGAATDTTTAGTADTSETSTPCFVFSDPLFLRTHHCFACAYARRLS